MQDRYAGDIGDFAKLGLLRALATGGGGEALRIGIHWYLVPNEGTVGDGRFVEYAKKLEGNEGFRQCDGDLWEKLGKVVAGPRSVASIIDVGAPPSRAVSFHERLSYDGAKDRAAHRSAWSARALAAMVSCDVVCADPDNGLEVESHSRTSKAGLKYAFYDELKPFLVRGTSVVVYQHVSRVGNIREQFERRLSEIRTGLPHGEHCFAMYFRSMSPRFFFVIPNPAHKKRLKDRSRALASGHWKDHFELMEV